MRTQSSNSPSGSSHDDSSFKIQKIPRSKSELSFKTIESISIIEQDEKESDEERSRTTLITHQPQNKEIIIASTQTTSVNYVNWCSVLCFLVLIVWISFWVGTLGIIPVEQKYLSEVRQLQRKNQHLEGQIVGLRSKHVDSTMKEALLHSKLIKLNDLIVFYLKN